MDPDTAMQSDVRSGRQVSGSMADDRGERARAEGLTNGPSQGAELAQARRLLDYEQSVAQVRQLTDVRFKLVAFVPTLTAAVVALLGTSNVDALTRVSVLT